MRPVNKKTFDDLLIDLIIREQVSDKTCVYERPYIQLPTPEPPPRKQEVEKEEASRVIVIDI